jgi:GAF domain-containing protein
MTSAVPAEGLDEQELLRRFLDALAQASGAEAITMWRFDEATGRFFGPAERGLRHRPEFLATTPRPDRVAGRIARAKQPEVNPAVRTSELAGPFVVREEIESFIGLPLMEGDHVYAVLFLSYRCPQAFDPPEVQRLVRAAEQVATEYALGALERRAPPPERLERAIDRRLTFMVDHGCTITNASIALWTIDRLNGKASIRSGSGLSIRYRNRASASLADANHLVTKVAADQEAEISDMKDASDAQMAAEWRMHRWGCIVGLPVRAGKEVIAVLTVSPNKRRAIASWEKIPVLRDLAQEIGEVLIEERRARTILRLNGLNLSFERSPRVPHMLDVVLEQAADLFDAQETTLYPYDSDCTMCGLPTGSTAAAATHDARSALTHRMVRDRLQVLSSDDETPQGYPSAALGKPAFSSWVALNLAADGHTEAVLFLDFRAPQALFDAQRDLFCLFGARAAHAIRAAQLFEQELRRNHVARAAESFAASKTEDEVGYALKRAVSSVLGGSRVENFHAMAAVRLPPGQEGTHQNGGEGDPLLAAARVTEAPGCWQENPDDPSQPLPAGAGRYMTIPFGFGEIRSVLGVESLKRPEAHYHTADLDILAELVQHASAALERVHYAQLQSRLLPAVSEVNEAVAQLLLLDQTCREIVDVAVEELKADVASVQLVNEELQTIEAVYGVNAPWTAEAVHGLSSKDIQAEIVERGNTEFIEGWDERFDRELYDKYGHEKLARFFVPISYGGRVLGTLEIGWDKSKRPDETRPADKRASKRAVERIVRNHAEKLWRSTFRHTVEVVLRKAVEMTGADSGTIHVMPKAAGGFVYESCEGRIGPEFIRAYPPAVDGIGSDARVSKTLKYIDDPLELSGTHKSIFEVRELTRDHPGRYPPGEGVRAIACFWFAPEDRYGGVLYIHFWRPHRFSPEECQLLEHFRDQLSKAILNANIHARLRDNSRALTAIELIRESVTGGFHLGTLLAKIAGSALRALNAKIVIIYTYDEKQKTFGVPPTIGGVEELRHPESMRTVVGDDDVPAQVVRRGENVYASDAQRSRPLHDPDRARKGGRSNTFVDREDIVSAAAVLLTAGTEHVGVMFVNYRDRRAFTDGERRLIESFGFYAALAIRNARTATQMMLEQMRAVGAIDLSVAPTLEPKRVFDLIVDKSKDNLLLRDGYATLQILDAQKRDLAIRACSGVPPEAEETRISLDDPDSVTAHVARTRRPLRIADIEKAPFYRSLVGGMRSELAVPLTRGARLIGVLNVESRQPEAFHETEEEFLTLLAKQAVTAIRNAEFTTHLQELWKALTAMRSHNDLPKILQRIAETAVGMAGVEWALIAPYDGGTDQVATGGMVFARDPSSTVELGALLEDGVVARMSEQAARIAGSGAARDIRPPEGNRPFAEIAVRMGSPTVVGMLLTGHGGPDPLPEAELVVLQAFAEQAATAVLVARTLEEQRKQGRLTVLGSRGLGFLHGVRRPVTQARERLEAIASAFSHHDLDGVGELIRTSDDLIENLKKMEWVGSKQRQKPVKQPVDVRRVVREAREMLGRVDSRIQFDLPGPGPLLRVRGDLTDLKAAVSELLRNAVDGIAPLTPGHISVDVSSPDPTQVRIRVADDGRGMGPEDAEACLTPFHTTKPGEHSGLGLYLVESVVLDHGGKLDVESGIGVGSAFTIQLPAI